MEKIIKLINSASTTLIGSVDKDGFPNIKAMLPPRKIENSNTFYFTTNTSSARVKQFRKNGKASIYFFNGLSFKGVMLTGKMEVMEDSKHKEMIWREGDDLYYPEGVNDPDYCVLKFTGKDYRFYENFSTVSLKVE